MQDWLLDRTSIEDWPPLNTNTLRRLFLFHLTQFVHVLQVLVPSSPNKPPLIQPIRFNSNSSRSTNKPEDEIHCWMTGNVFVVDNKSERASVVFGCRRAGASTRLQRSHGDGRPRIRNPADPSAQVVDTVFRAMWHGDQRRRLDSKPFAILCSSFKITENIETFRDAKSKLQLLLLLWAA